MMNFKKAFSDLVMDADDQTMQDLALIQLSEFLSTVSSTRERREFLQFMVEATEIRDFLETLKKRNEKGTLDADKAAMVREVLE